MSEEILFLKKGEASVLLIEERLKKDIMIAAPHHAVGGEKNLPCIEHLDADENTGFIARRIAEKLNISSIIACNYHIDVNKEISTDYALHIIKWKPKYLIEIHGHGSRYDEKKGRPDDYTLQVSCGSKEKTETALSFAKLLQVKFMHFQSLTEYQVQGNFENIYFKAKDSKTITDNRWTSLHIELPRSLRLDENNRLPHFTDSLVECFADAISEFCI